MLRENLIALVATFSFMAGSVTAFAALTGFAVLITAPASFVLYFSGCWLARKVET